jgi:hypothetical protein
MPLVVNKSIPQLFLQASHVMMRSFVSMILLALTLERTLETLGFIRKN